MFSHTSIHKKYVNFTFKIDFIKALNFEKSIPLLIVILKCGYNKIILINTNICEFFNYNTPIEKNKNVVLIIITNQQNK